VSISFRAAREQDDRCCHPDGNENEYRTDAERHRHQIESCLVNERRLNGVVCQEGVRSELSSVKDAQRILKLDNCSGWVNIEAEIFGQRR